MSDEKKIIIATIMRIQGKTGVQTHFNKFIKYLTDKEKDFSIITPFSFPFVITFFVFGIRLIIDKLNGTWSVWWYRYWHFFFLKLVLLRKLHKFARDKIAVVIYAQCPLSAKAAMEGRDSSKQKVIMVAHFNNSQAEEWADKGKIKKNGAMYKKIKVLEKRVLPLLDGIVYVSEYMKNIIEKNNPEVSNVKSIVLLNFIDIPQKIESKIKGDLINIGGLEPRKNQSYLLKVLSEAKKKGRNYTLSIIGDGPNYYSLKSLARSLGVSHLVKFEGFKKNASQFIYNHKVYVHSSFLESCGIVLIEAMACKKPILAGKAGGISELFFDGIEGFYWPLNDPVVGANKLIQLMENQELYNRMSKAAYKRFLNNFNLEMGAQKLSSFIYDI